MLKRSVIAVAMAIGGTSITFAQTVSNSGNVDSNNGNVNGEKQVTRVVVTGSNLKRADAEGPNVVSVMTAQDIKNTGAQSVADLVKLIPSMGAGSNQDFGSGSGFAKGVATASMRGLGSSSTLVLLNGRRLTPSAYADPNDGNSVLYDLNSIPLSAIERVEVLQDGASAVYGSDAIAGVINFILKSNYNGAELSARYSANDNNNFGKKGFSAIFGHGDLDVNGYSFMVTADLNQRDRTARKEATDIEYAQYQLLNGRFKSNYSSSVSQYPTYYKETKPGSKNFGVTQATGPTNMKFNLGCPADQQITGGTKDGLLPTSTLIGRTFCNYDIDQFAEAQGYGRDANILSHGEFKLGGGVTAFAELAYSRSRRDYTGAPISIGTTSVNTFTANGVGTPFQAILPIGHPDNPFTDARSSVGYRFLSLRGGSSTINEGARALVGVRGSNLGWDWESALLWNRSNRDETQYGRLYLPTLNKLNTGTSLAALNADPSLGHDVLTENSAQIAQWDLKASREFGHLPGGAIGVAAGVEARQEKVGLNPDALVSSGQIYGLSNTILDSSRNVKSVFAEVRTPWFKNFETDFAGRIDKYDGLARNFVPKVGFKYTVTDSFAFRGTYAKGFRAPSLSQIKAGGAQFFQSGVWDPKRCETDQSTPKPNATATDCSRSIAGVGGFNPDLKPETSKSWSLGFIYSPNSSIDLLADWFRVRQDGQIILGSTSDALKNEDRFPQNVTRDPNPVNWVTDASGKPVPGTGPLLMVANPWINEGMTEVSGVDIEAKFRKRMGAYGSLSTTVRSTYTASYKIRTFPGDPSHNLAGSVPGISDWAISGGSPTPRWKSIVSTTWTQGDNQVNLSVNYTGPVSYLRRYDGDTTYAQPFCYYGTKKPTDAAPDRNTTVPLYENYYPSCSIKEWVTVGLGYTYTGIKHWTFNANVQNMFDNKAPYDPATGASGFNEQLHNPYGRYFNLSARYTF
jgi:iron complex outermembrane receptor protein